MLRSTLSGVQYFDPSIFVSSDPRVLLVSRVRPSMYHLLSTSVVMTGHAFPLAGKPAMV
jgi:hypothetical protein